MRVALAEAVRAPEHGDVPVGAVAVAGGKVIAARHNAMAFPPSTPMEGRKRSLESRLKANRATSIRYRVDAARRTSTVSGSGGSALRNGTSGPNSNPDPVTSQGRS
jgi:hypothetical protein